MSSAAKAYPKTVGPSHPSYSDMIVEAIKTIKDRKGASRASIGNFIAKKYLTADRVKPFVLARALVSAIANNTIKVKSKGRYVIGPQKLTKKKKKVAKKATKKSTTKKHKVKKSTELKKTVKEPANLSTTKKNDLPLKAIASKKTVNSKPAPEKVSTTKAAPFKKTTKKSEA